MSMSSISNETAGVPNKQRPEVDGKSDQNSNVREDVYKALLTTLH